MTAQVTGTDARRDMVYAMCAAVDRGDAESFGSWFDENATYTFANEEPIVGRDGIVAATAAAVGALPWIRHRVDDIAEFGDRLFCGFTIETSSAEGPTVTLPCMTVIRLGITGVIDYRVYMDLGPTAS